MNMSNQTITVQASEPDSQLGYRSFQLGQFRFTRDAYFVRIEWPNCLKTMEIGHFLHVLARTLGQNFFYGWVYFDEVFGTVNHFDQVEVFAGKYSEAYTRAGVGYAEKLPVEEVRSVFEAIAADWINDGYDPMAAPVRVGTPYGPKGKPSSATFKRGFTPMPKRMLGMQDDTPPRVEQGLPINPAFADMKLDLPELLPEPGFEAEIHAINVFDHIARSDVSWIPSITSVTRQHVYCMSSEEEKLAITHGNDRPEWFIQLTDEIHWEIMDNTTGAARGRVVMRPGDVCAMPADIKHQGYAPKRAMLLVVENGSPDLPEKYAKGLLPPFPVQF
jgi:hypothetical protein